MGVLETGLASSATLIHRRRPGPVWCGSRKKIQASRAWSARLGGLTPKDVDAPLRQNGEQTVRTLKLFEDGSRVLNILEVASS